MDSTARLKRSSLVSFRSAFGDIFATGLVRASTLFARTRSDRNLRVEVNRIWRSDDGDAAATVMCDKCAAQWADWGRLLRPIRQPRAALSRGCWKSHVFIISVQILGETLDSPNARDTRGVEIDRKQIYRAYESMNIPT